MTTSFEESIIKAIEEGNTEEVRVALSKGVDVNMEDKYGQSLLVMSANTGNQEIVKLLKNEGATNRRDIVSEDWSWLRIYACCGMKKEVEDEIKAGIDLNSTSDNEWSELMAIILSTPKEQFEIVKMLVDNGADVNRGADSGSSALLMSVKKGFLRTAEYLIQEGANINDTDDDGWDAAYTAVMEEQTEILEMLIKNGADVNKIYFRFQSDSETLLDVAYERDLTDIISILKKHGANKMV